LIVFLCGGQSFPNVYEIAGSEFVLRGYAVAFLSQAVELPTGPPPAPAFTLNFVGPNDILTAINLFQSANSPILNMADPTRIVLLAHSFGGSSLLYYLGNTCSQRTFCCSKGPGQCFLGRPEPPVALDAFANGGRPLPEIAAAAAFATTAISQGGQVPVVLNRELLETASSTPFAIINGEYDAKNCDLDNNGKVIIEETLNIIGFDGNNVPNDELYFISLKGLDHYSISDALGSAAESVNYANSELGRNVQVKASVEALHFWLQQNPKVTKSPVDRKVEHICRDILFDSDLLKFGTDIVKCQGGTESVVNSQFGCPPPPPAFESTVEFLRGSSSP
jgi:hypothetical protein